MRERRTRAHIHPGNPVICPCPDWAYQPGAAASFTVSYASQPASQSQFFDLSRFQSSYTRAPVCTFNPCPLTRTSSLSSPSLSFSPYSCPFFPPEILSAPERTHRCVRSVSPRLVFDAGTTLFIRSADRTRTANRSCSYTHSPRSSIYARARPFDGGHLGS